MQNNFVVKSVDFKPTMKNVKIEENNRSDGGWGRGALSMDSSPIIIETHPMKLPFGFSNGQYGPMVNINLDTNNVEDKILYDGLVELEKIIVSYAYKYRVKWLLGGSKTQSDAMTTEMVKGKFKPIITMPKMPQYPASMKIKMMTNKAKEITTYCYNENKEKIVPSEQTIPRGCMALLNMKADSMYIMPDGSYGVSWSLIKITVCGGSDNGSGNNGLKPLPFTSSSMIFNGDSDGEAEVVKITNKKCLLADDDD